MDVPIEPLIAWTVLAPLAGSVLTFVLPDRRGVPAAAIGVVALVHLAAVTVAALQVVGGGPVRVAVGGWDAPAGIELVVDGLAVAFLAVVLVIEVAASICALGLLRHDGTTPRPRTFWPLWFLLWAGLDALFLTSDLFNLYVTLELVGLSGVALVATAGGAPALRAALRYFFANVAASLVLLAGVALVYHRYGTLDLALLRSAAIADAATATALALVSGALALKAALFPLHAWLPAAHSAAPAPVSALLSALVVKGPVVLLLRLWFDAFSSVLDAAAPALLGALGCVAIVWGSSQAMRAPRLKLLVAHSTIAQVGLLVAAFPVVRAAGSDAAWSGLVLLAVAHALAKGAMFLAAGGIARAHGHDDLDRLAGFGARAPACAFAFGIAGMSLVGIPGTLGFVGKWMIAVEGMRAGAVVWVLVVAGSALLTAAYVWRVIALAMRSDTRAGAGEAVPRRVAWPALALAGTALVLGVVPGPLATLVAEGRPEPLQEAPR